MQIAARVQPRDVVLARLLDEHGVLTTDQIAAVLFSSSRTCRNRLDVLRRAHFIARFTPAAGPGGSDPIAPRARLSAGGQDHSGPPDSHAGRDRRDAPGGSNAAEASRRHPPVGRPASAGAVSHWVSGPASARWAALATGRPAPTARAVRDRQDSLAASTHLAHTVGVNQFFVDLIAYSRAHPGSRLTRWWPASRTAAACGRLIHPDGHGVWRTTRPAHIDAKSDAENELLDELDDETSRVLLDERDDVGRVREVGFFLEHDTGTESHRQLTGKLDAYQRLRARGGPDLPVLFWLPTQAREANLHHRLADVPWVGLTIATAARDHAAGNGGPAGRVWRIAGNGRHRLPLADLPSHLDGSGPYPVGPPAAEDDPLYLPAPPL